jgi:hypothetical protein
MHNYSQGSSVSLLPNAYLLRQADPSSTCLNCHQRAGDIGPTTYHISTPINEMIAGTPPKQLTPGGDFGWLHRTFEWIISGPTISLGSSPGERHGHNILAADFLYDIDSTYPSAPGGSYPSERLACTSCHDPHGRYKRDASGIIGTSNGKGPTGADAMATVSLPTSNSGSFAGSGNPIPGISAVGVYRMLGGIGYQPKSLTGLAFVNNPPAAVAPDRPNRSEAVTQTRVAYGSGMSEWCANCHRDIHTGMASLRHPAGAMPQAKLGTITISTDLINTKAYNYNRYIRTGDLSGQLETSYLSLVPFEEGTTDYATIKPLATSDVSVVLTGPGPAAQVMCLTCHRAHASGWDGSMRWNTKTDFVVFNGSYAPAANPAYSQGRTEAEALRAYYDRPASTFALNQDTLCNKCHNGVYP